MYTNDPVADCAGAALLALQVDTFAGVAEPLPFGGVGLLGEGLAPATDVLGLDGVLVTAEQPNKKQYRTNSGHKRARPKTMTTPCAAELLYRYEGMYLAAVVPARGKQNGVKRRRYTDSPRDYGSFSPVLRTSADFSPRTGGIPFSKIRYSDSGNFMRRTIAVLCLAALLAVTAVSATDPGKLSNLQRDYAVAILRETVNTVRKNYFDATLHGVDLEAREKIAEQKIRDAANFGAAFGQIAWTLEALDDSHTAFDPPSRPYRTDNGWSVQVVGDKCLITAVRPNSDAAAQGLKPGDELVALDGFRVTAPLLHKIMYAFNVLSPHSAHEMVVASPGAQPRKLIAKVSYETLPRHLDNPNDWMEMLRQSQLDDEVYAPRTVESGDVMVYKLPEFAISEHQVDEMFSKATHYKTLVIDLRGNPGGAEDVLTDMLGHLFDHQITIGNRVSRKDKKPVIAKPHGHHFDGKLIVLIDQGSASCSELFARVVQLEKRGIVVGDHSAGYVRESMFYPRTEGAGSAMWYAVQVSVSDLIMADGKSLEHNPVVPDELVVPTPADLSFGRDPVLARAIEIAGGKATADQAGTMFPVLWKKM